MSKKDIAALPDANQTETVNETVTETVTETAVPAEKVFARRGKLEGLELTKMTDDQLRVELVNSKSVVAKATARKASPDKIALAKVRVAEAEAEKASRPTMAKKVKEVKEEVKEVKEEVVTETVYAEDATEKVTEEVL